MECAAETFGEVGCEAGTARKAGRRIKSSVSVGYLLLAMMFIYSHGGYKSCQVRFNEYRLLPIHGR